jgi:NitT/TauT family transport system permease protein
MARRVDQAPDPYAPDIAGLDALDVPVAPHPSLARRTWMSAWPRLAAVVVAIGGWELVSLSSWKKDYQLPGPAPVFGRLWSDLLNLDLFRAAATTLQRAGIGYGLAVLIGGLVGLVVSRSRVVRAAIGSLLTGLQTMPTIAWFPLTILLFGLSETAILFVVVLGAAPAVANGLIAGVDHIPPLLLRAGRVLGARGLATYRHIVIPAALPGFVGGLKQGWAFAWRSLMAGELLVIIASKPSLGQRLDNARQVSDAEGLIAAMIVVLLIGITVDSFGFARAETAIRRRWGLLTD